MAWENRAILTPTPAENWGYKELELGQQFIILPATIQGFLVLSQRLRQGVATYLLAEETRIPLPDELRIQPYLWIERNPPPSEQVNFMLDSLEKYLSKDGFYWLSACAVFPELHWHITIYLGNVLKTESGASLIDVCSLADLARLPWLRYGYIPDWLRVYLINTLTPQQQQIIRTALQNLLITAVQGSVSKLQLEIARKYHTLLTKLANSILDLLSKRADVNSPLRDYIFLDFMRHEPVLAIKVSDEFSRVLQRQKRFYWWIKVLRKLGIVNQVPSHRRNFVELANSNSSLINRRRFLKWFVWGGVSLLTSTLAHHITQNYSRNTNTWPSPGSAPNLLEAFDFEIVVVNSQGNTADRAQRTAQYFIENLGNGVTLEMVAIPSGSFMMGSPGQEQRRNLFESPQRQVNLSGFFMGKYEVTQAQYQAVMGNNPANFQGETRPIEQVSWENAIEFCQKLRQITGRNYRLPSEAEWEYACRSGTTTPFYFGLTITAELVNYDGSRTYASAPQGLFRRQTTPVGSFPPNAFGLYDMHGNVWEWCQDHWHDSYNGAPTDGSVWLNDNDNQSLHLLRGGSWYDIPEDCRSAFRNYFNRNRRSNYIGFRVVCDGVGVRTSFLS
ncbi:formylglycine-generating enzyme family protein [Anabaena subtropica FACHB-260]|uniref:Formylglycine-generating enzyme family protein n=2 Tax=Anabaena TaxID=1163 RepID=A0ABR8CSP0_9NOST|nr:formylglycine-generating enzyme family protein [Anabaena subtropica FACHB-260]